MNRIIAFLLIFLLIPNLSYGKEQSLGFSNFNNVSSYKEGQFSDVADSAWYAKNVASVYGLGLMKGINENTFGSNANITVADTITLACRLHSIYYHDGHVFSDSTPWYSEYVDYALENRIIKNGFLLFSRNATRVDFAMIIADSLPAEVFEPINIINDGIIPEIQSAAVYYDAVYKLYRAGILTGNDSQGTFSPYETMTRKEVAAIMARVVDNNLRKQITLTNKSLSLNYDYVYISENEKVKLSVHDESGKMITSGITWKSSGPESVEVNNGIVHALNDNFGREMITATTAQGAEVHCMVIYKSKEIISKPNGGISVYVRYPSIYSIDNVCPDIALAYQFETSLPDLGIYKYYYTYQARTLEDAELTAIIYAKFLEQAGYTMIKGVDTSGEIPVLENYISYEFTDPSGQYLITVTATIAPAGDRFQHPNVDVSIEEAK
jgi:S-layer homology domain.